ncbi:TetR family transcriptional regulator [Caldicellulosiruptor bescii]|jgi:AcrR family transcriptional regulator|uniref:Transcriptional regulator, TetR family n=2 Tax=Caldicellulosiruptor bescii TaxID=31899 RepID=B9MK22_CALBD|nr:TetR/AcrR family transcriptional regulator [Caldicellulosiruptor bescii]ACM60680.1 transcriptional regulator, TetR family [Caldicellulosiruptor bescii DSM 6725]PBC88087.1 TetR family transcriptional regulator [Caldicellulosiruptor bescii]PBC91019.1 TetR family transcriptional regulator [Caldicellulosiruptor bescii]PBD06818.1 TetR family transcriptional regulator [Caldicellulosiruptor bescii]PBD08178.1 TetR family transcriptional regulator [Caldicellulosiruptor bescii]
MPKQTFLNLPEEKRNLITDTLIKYFSQKPYHEVDISDIAKECNVAKGSMYQYFENKKDMYFYALEVSYQRFLELLEKLDMMHVNLFDYYENSLETIWIAMKELKSEYLLLERAFFSQDSPFKDEINEKFLKQSREFLVKIIKYNQQKGYIRDDIDPVIISIFLEGASFYMKKFVIEEALSRTSTTLDLDISYFKDALSQFIKLLKEGIGKK